MESSLDLHPGANWFLYTLIYVANSYAADSVSGCCNEVQISVAALFKYIKSHIVY